MGRHETIVADQSAADARSLARLLVYAVDEARALNEQNCAARIEEALAALCERRSIDVTTLAGGA
jgi:hypothetical protein